MDGGRPTTQPHPAYDHLQAGEIFDCTDGELCLQEVAPQKMGQAVLIQGLPDELCTGPLLHIVFEQAGLKDRIRDCLFQHGPLRARGSTCNGEALLWFSEREFAEYAVWRFRGSCWNNGGALVNARLVETAAMPEVSSELSLSLAQRLLDAVLASPEEWPRGADGKKIEAPRRLIPKGPKLTSPGHARVMKRLSTIGEEKFNEHIATEVSTDAGASEVSTDEGSD